MQTDRDVVLNYLRKQVEQVRRDFSLGWTDVRNILQELQEECPGYIPKENPRENVQQNPKQKTAG